MKFLDKIKQSRLVQQHPTLLEFIKFSVVGISGTIVDFGIYTLLTRLLDLYYIYATAISVFLAIINNFFLNKYWTFKKGNTGQTKIEYTKFFIVSIINYFLNIGITYSLVEFTHAELIFGNNEDFFAKVTAIIFVLFGNYLGNKYWTFRN